MRVLVSTFADGDDEKVLLAMRKLPYDSLPLLVAEDVEGPSLERIRRLEDLSGHEVSILTIETGGFMSMVDSISEELSALSFDRASVSRNEPMTTSGIGALLAGV